MEREPSEVRQDPLVDEVDGDPGGLHPGGERLPDRVETGEGRQQGGVDVDDPVAEAGDEGRAQQLHVAGEDDEVGIERLDPLAERLVPRRPVRVVSSGEGGGLDLSGTPALQRPGRALVGADPHHLDPLAPVHLVEDRLQVGAAARGKDDDPKRTHARIFAEATCKLSPVCGDNLQARLST
jgi:hypothetical protein